MIEPTPLEQVANAIILQAVKDYRSALGGGTVNGKSPGDMIAECERFFLSDWFMVLTNLDGEALKDKIRKEFKK